jgi:hypothetical protein
VLALSSGIIVQILGEPLRYDGGAVWGTGLARRFAFGVAVIAACLIFAAAQSSRAQNQTPAQTPPASTTPPGNSSSPAPIPDANKPPEASHGQHTVTVTFDYDFGLTPACTKKIIKSCVQQFVAYDISAGAKQASFLFPIPLPANPVGAVKGITATSPKLDFESGKHLISVTAQGPDGRQSKKSVCSTWIVIP